MPNIDYIMATKLKTQNDIEFEIHTALNKFKHEPSFVYNHLFDVFNENGRFSNFNKHQKTLIATIDKYAKNEINFHDVISSFLDNEYEFYTQTILELQYELNNLKKHNLDAPGFKTTLLEKYGSFDRKHTDYRRGMDVYEEFDDDKLSFHDFISALIDTGYSFDDPSDQNFYTYE